jgi:hypothetical protein
MYTSSAIKPRQSKGNNNMLKDTYNQSMTSLLRGLIDYNFKRVIDRPAYLHVTLTNNIMAITIEIDKARNKTTLGAYNKLINMPHNDKVLFTSSSTTKAMINAVYNHIYK